MAVGTNTRRHIVFNVFTYTFAVSLLVAAIQIGNNPLKVGRVLSRMPVLRGIANGQRFRRAIEHYLTLLFRQFTPGCIKAKVISFRQSFQYRRMPLAAIDYLAPRRNCTLRQAQFRMAYDSLHIDL